MAVITDSLLVEERGTTDPAALSLIAADAPTDAVLLALLEDVERRHPLVSAATVLLMGPDGRLHPAGAPSLPQAFWAPIADGLPVGRGAGACGAAALLRHTVVTRNIANDPDWSDFAAHCAAHGLAACFSTPILSVRTGDVLGTFGIYSSCVRAPVPEEIASLEHAARIVAIALERSADRSAVHRRIAQQEAIAELAGLAVRAHAAQPVLDAAAAAVAQHLHVACSTVALLTEQRDEVELRAAVGLPTGARRPATPPEASAGAYALVTDGVVSFEADRPEPRFDAGLLRQAGLVSGLMTRIPGAAGPHGVLGAHAENRAAFTSEDRGFVLSVAAVVGGLLDRLAVEERLRHESRHDPLTGLPNRAALFAALDASLDASLVGPPEVGVLALDLDHFKDINDTFGHPTGDVVLCRVADALRGALRPHDVLARVGGDEFVVLCAGVTSPDDLAGVALRLVEACATPFDVGGRPLFVGVSAGGAIAGPGAGADQLLADADVALYAAKGRGRGRFEVHDARLHAEVVARAEVEQDLRAALDPKALDVVYQPVVDLRTGAVVEVEALLRWTHPERGPIAAGDVVATAERTGLIGPIGRWLLDEACGQLAMWRAAGAPGLRDARLSINVSPVQLADPALPDAVSAALAAHGLPPAALGLEVTGSGMLEDLPAAHAALTRLRALGIRLALDDFGTGAASLGQLRDLPLDAVKLDPSFAAGCATAPRQAALVGALRGMAEVLGLDLVVEGLAGAAEIDAVRAAGCTLGQGFGWCAPVAADELARWAAAR